MRFFGILLAVFLVQACGANEEATAVQHKEHQAKVADNSQARTATKDFNDLSITELKRLDTQLLQTINSVVDLRCDTDAQCKSIAVGVNPCGGPLQYKIYSQLATDESKLRRAVEKYNRLNTYMNKRLGRVGACVYLQEPMLSCKKNRCESKSLAIM